MKLLNIVFFSGCFLLFSTITKAQNEFPDYVITMNGDTIHCKISNSLFNSHYVTSGNTQQVKIKPDSIHEYCITHKKDITVYKSVVKEGHSSHEFLNVIEKGKIDLFEEDLNNRFGSKNLFISKGSDTAYILKTNQFLITKSKEKRKNTFADMLKDNEDVYNKYITEDKFSFKQLQSLVHLYNTGEPLEK